jgi:hypothetical protein
MKIVKRLPYLVSLFIILTFFHDLFSQSIAINEVMSNNVNTIFDVDGDSPDWIELYNYGSEPINLYNFGISDNKENLSKWLFPDISIDPQKTLLIFASNKLGR